MKKILLLSQLAFFVAAFMPNVVLSADLDFGDAPEAVGAPGYPTSIVNNGANHEIKGPWLGDSQNFPDPEADGQPDPSALGDDNAGDDDENGIHIPALFQGRTGDINIEVNGGGGILEAWIDFDGNRTWQHPEEQIFADFLSNGTHSISVAVPSNSIVGQTFARFRISSSGGLTPVGVATNGEVEDHVVNINESFVEHDHFEQWQAVFELIMPSGSTETLQLKGPLVEHVYFEGGEGEATDDDGDMLDEVQSEIVSMNLAGTSSLGAVTVQQNPSIPSLGEIEETSNITSGWLDVCPFVTDGTADSFFDVFVVLSVGTMVLHNVEPMRISALINHKPPYGDTVYQCSPPLSVELFDENNDPTGILLGCGPHRPNPTVEIDQFDYSSGVVELVMPDSTTETIPVSGSTTINVYFEGSQEGDAEDDDLNSRDEVQTEIVAMNLMGVGPTLGPVTVRLHPTIPSKGKIEETVDVSTGRLDLPPFGPSGTTADSFFDIYYEIEMGGQLLYTQGSKRMISEITHKPPGPDDEYENRDTIPLYDATGRATGIFLGLTRHKLRPTYCNGDLDRDGDADGSDLAIFVAGTSGVGLEELAKNFGRTNCFTNMTYHENLVRDFAVYNFEKIRKAVDPEDVTRPEVAFIGNHVEVKSENWVYILDIVGHQTFRPLSTYSLIKDSLLPETDISPILDRWIREPVPQGIVDEAKRMAMVALGIDYNGTSAVEVFPARELISSRDIDTDTTTNHEGRTIVMIRPAIPDEQKVTKYMTWMLHDSDTGESSIQYYPIRLPPRSYETSITLIKGKVVRIESNAPQSPQNLEIVDTFREGRLEGFVLRRNYDFNFLTFGEFFSPDEWAFEYNAYAWQGEDFAIDGSSLCPAYPTGLPCHDDYWLDFDFYRNTPLYHDMFLSEWCDLGMYNGIRGNCLDYDPIARSCLSWEIPRAVIHMDLGQYNPVQCPYGGCIDNGFFNFEHCNGDQNLYLSAYGYRMDQQFYDDLETCHVAMVSTHGGQARCDAFRFFQFKKQYQTWVSLHREGDDGLGNGNLRHLFLQTCDSMGRFHSEKHGNQQIFESEWINNHIADGIRTICGLDGPAAGKKGAHVTGLPFFSHYLKGDPIIDAFFSQELDACDCNTPVTIAFGATEQEAASTLFDGRFETQRAGTGHIMIAEVITPHLVQHQACCLPEPDPQTNKYCVDIPSYECESRGGNPAGSGTHCNWVCPFQSDLVFCNP